MLPYASNTNNRPPNMFPSAYSCLFLNATCTGLRTRGTRQTELLHSLTVKFTETFTALRQAAEGGKKRLWLAARRSVSMTSNMLIRVAPFIHRTCCVQNHYRGEGEESWHRQARVFMGSGMPLIYALIHGKSNSSACVRCCQSCVCVRTGAGHTLRLIHSAMTRTERGRLDATRSFTIPALPTHLENSSW